jgi:DNA-binding SARP family transcriptional activator
VDFRILGTLEVIGDAGDCQIRGAKLRTVLGLLLVHPNQPVSNDALIDAVWGDAPPPSALGTLQTYVYQLRKALGPDAIRTGPTGYALHVATDDIDAYRFEHAAMAREEKTGAVAARLTQALGWWRGAALADFDGAEWARTEAARLELLRIDATERLIDARLALGEYAAVIPDLEGLTSRHPLREHFSAQLMLALYRSDRQADALRVYTRLRDLLRDELGLDPSRELGELERAILAQAPGLDRPAATSVAPPAINNVARSRSPHYLRAAIVLAVTIAVVVSSFALVEARSHRARATTDLTPTGYRPRYRALPCPKHPTVLDLPADSSELCGVLTVPENRARPHGRTIDLDVFRFPARVPRPAADPVVQVGAEFVASAPPSDTALRTHGDSIFLAGRGFYGSSPRLTCPEVSAEMNASLGRKVRDPRNPSDLAGAVRKCRVRLTAQGIDVAAYSAAERATDVRDLAFVLRLHRINLLAARTMTVEAREIAGRYPSLVRSITLFDVVPPQANPWNGEIANATGALDRFVGDCLNESACGRAYPHLRQQIEVLYDAAQARPLVFVENNPWAKVPARLRVLLDGDRVLELVLAALNQGSAGLVPAAVATKNSAAAAQAAAAVLATPADASWGALLSRNCIDLIGSVSFEGLDIEAKATPHLDFLAHDPLLPLCAAWRTPPTRTFAPGPAGTPTLVLIGALDPNTSLDWAHQTAVSFGHATVIQLPHTGAVDSTVDPCVERLRNEFLADPTRPVPTDACARAIDPVTFAGA